MHTIIIIHTMQSQKYIYYKTEYTQGLCRGYAPPKPVVVTVQSTAMLITIMETAGDMNDKYQFEAEFDGDYHITVMNGRPNTDNCTWFVYVTSPGEAESMPGSLWDSPRNRSLVTVRYKANEPGPPSGTLSIYYLIEYDPNCSLRRPPSVYRTKHFKWGGSALEVIWSAVNDCKHKVSSCDCSLKDYVYSSIYCPGKGFKIDMIDNTPNDPKRLCFWTLYYVIPGYENSPVKLNISPARFVFLSDDYGVLMRYEQDKTNQTCDTMEVIM